MAVRALWFDRGTLHLVDQRRLPGQLRVLHLRTLDQVAAAIRNMTVRGAPAIGVAAAYGMALGARERRYTPAKAAAKLGATRPTAVDLFVGIAHVRNAWQRGDDPTTAADEYRAMVVDECRRIGDAGASLFAGSPRVLTHCNAGALATVEWGTALAPLRVAHERGSDLFVWVDETRPLLQGSRLTAWELAQEHIRHAIIVDNAAGHFMRDGQVDRVIVGADRIARNGDFANKIGTYEKAVVAHENRIPFYVAAPWTTFDAARRSGRDIPVEERDGREVLGGASPRTAPARSAARNPAFDVTPARYVTGFVTPEGVVPPGRLAAVLRRRATQTADSSRRRPVRLPG